MLLADDNFYPVTLTDLELASRQGKHAKTDWKSSRLCEKNVLISWRALHCFPPTMIFFTQITMEAAEIRSFLEAMRKANIKGLWSASNRSRLRVLKTSTKILILREIA